MLGRAVVRFRWLVLVMALGVLTLGVTWGGGVFGDLISGGFDDPASESSRAHRAITAQVGRQDIDVIALYTAADPLPVAQTAIGKLKGRPEITAVQSGPLSHDGRSVYVAIQLREGVEDAKLADLEAIRPLLVADAPATTQIGGIVAFLDDASDQISEDITRAEIISLPILLILLIFIFRGMVAALTPLLVGILAVLGAFTTVRLLAQVTDVSVFAINIITMLGLGMAIDYSLFVVSRFREELAAGRSTSDAVAIAVARAGRTVFVSGLTVALALASLLVFPMDFLKSMAWGGMSAVLVAMVAALTALPALLAVLGPRINALRVPLPRLRRAAPAVSVHALSAPTPPAQLAGQVAGSSDGDLRAGGDDAQFAGQVPRSSDGDLGVGGDDAQLAGHVAGSSGGWARLARSVMRRPVLYLLGVTALLLALATPFLHIQLGGFDERVMPEGTESRVVSQRLISEFPGGDYPITVLVEGPVGDLSERISALPNATGVRVAAQRGGATLLSVSYVGEPTSEAARQLVRDIRALPEPGGTRVVVGGRSAEDVDEIGAFGDRLPLMLLLIAGTTFLLLFLAFGSVVLPLKAIVMNIISIGASFGIVVWVFQDGHLAGPLGFTVTGFLEPANLVLMLAILFGLATDYEVFLLSRVREEWDACRDNRRSVALGLQRTGGIITAAALLLIVVVAGFATGGTATIKLLGVGTVVAIAIDATLVRTLLVPATMRLLGRWNWWAPKPLASVYRRFGIRES